MTSRISVARRRLLLAALGASVCGPFASRAAESPVTVFAAASLTDVLRELEKRHATRGGRLRLSFGSSAILARQIEQGAAADVFASADLEWMDYLQERGLIAAATRRNVLGNRLVLIAPADSTLRLKLVPAAPVAAALGDRGRIALADPDSVPAGRYAKAAFESLGLWSSLEERVARAENVRAALALVARGEAPLGVVYVTDARVEQAVRVVDVFPADSHPPIVYPFARLARAAAGADAVLAFLTDDAAGEVYRRAGFEYLGGRRA